jgi:hypothetical protein
MKGGTILSWNTAKNSNFFICSYNSNIEQKYKASQNTLASFFIQNIQSFQMFGISIVRVPVGVPWGCGLRGISFFILEPTDFSPCRWDLHYPSGV